MIACKLVWSTTSGRLNLLFRHSPVAADWSNLHCKPDYRQLTENLSKCDIQ